MTLYYVVALLVIFYLLVMAEFFLPTGGVLGFSAVAALIAAIVIAFSYSVTAGMTVIVLTLGTAPLLLLGLLRIWPYTPIGRRMLNRRLGEPDKERPARVTSHGVPMNDLVGRVGRAKTNLLPSGLVVIDDEKIDAISTGMPIDAGTTVIVTSIELGRAHVRQAHPEELPDAPEPAPQSPPSLEGSLDTLDFD